MNIASIIDSIDNYLWGWPLIAVLFGTHLFMTFRTGFIQKEIFKAIKLSVTKDKDAPGDVSQFGAITTAFWISYTMKKTEGYYLYGNMTDQKGMWQCGKFGCRSF